MTYTRSKTGFDAVNVSMSLAFLYILYDVVIRLQYTATMSYFDRVEATIEAGGEGGLFKYTMYALISAACLALVLTRTRRIGYSPISIAYHVASLWCILSFLWAIDPAAAFKRSITSYLILLTFTFSIAQLGTERSLRLLYAFAAFIVVGSLVTVLLHDLPMFAFSIHPAEEADQGVAGGWRGIMPHKNTAGAVATHAAIIFFFHGLARKKPIDWVLFLLSVVLIIGSKSKTSLLLLFLVFACGIFYVYLMRHYGSAVFKTACIALAGAALVLVIALWDSVTVFFTTDDNLTGRIAIWRSMFPFISDHFWLGAGYGSFWAIGDKSPIFELARTDFVTRIASSHNGYIEVWATTGFVGLILALLALAVLPFRNFANPERPNQVLLNGMLFTIWLFGILQNFTESQFFAPERQSWIFVVAAITIAHMRSKTAATSKAGQSQAPERQTGQFRFGASRR